MLNRFSGAVAVAAAAFLNFCTVSLAGENPFIGAWALTIPGGHAGWLGVEKRGDGLAASMMWGWGSVEPVASAKVEEGKLVITRRHNVERKESGRTIKTNIIETITGTVEGDRIQLTSRKPRESGEGEVVAELQGKRQPPMPPAPDLSKVKFGKRVKLFNGKDLSGWRLTDPSAVNGWSVQDGLLVNRPKQEEGKPHKNYGNLRTDGEFEDFNVRVEVRLPEKGNSGLYLRGIYEIQVADSYGQPPSSHGMGALYSRIKPVSNPSRRPGEWQITDVTLIEQHVTVKINGVTVIDNQPALGCTGGALWSDVTRPGPIYLQGDHTGVEYRSIVLRPVITRKRS